MNIFNKKDDFSQAVSDLKLAGKTIGFVPTMGALHEGHLSLIRRCKAENDVCVASIFVNPTQFNNVSDLQTYPRNLQQDTDLLNAAGCDLVFAPTEEEIYTEKEKEQPFVYDFEGLDKVMEGKFRPGHFNGVVQIVSKLFTLARPNRAYFGEKDFQQVAIICQMVHKLDFPVEIVSCPIKREESGLAMSSRNELLSGEERKKATNISKVLKESVTFAAQFAPTKLAAWITQQINATDGLETEYCEIVDGNTLQSISDWNETDYVVCCVTVFCGKVRLIDNIVYNHKL